MPAATAPHVDQARCTGCGLCSRFCPDGVLQAGATATPIPGADVVCIGCGHCAAVCPNGALTVEGLEHTPVTAASGAPGYESLRALLDRRRSVRRFRPHQVDRRTVDRILEAAGEAPSATNARVVRVLALPPGETRNRVREATLTCYRKLLRLLSLPGAGPVFRLAGLDGPARQRLRHELAHLTAPTETDRLFFEAPLLLVFTCPSGDDMATGDAWLAADHACLAAESLGLGSCHIGYLVWASAKNRSVARALGLPPKVRAGAVLALGWPDAPFRRHPKRAALPVDWI